MILFFFKQTVAAAAAEFFSTSAVGVLGLHPLSDVCSPLRLFHIRAQAWAGVRLWWVQVPGLAARASGVALLSNEPWCMVITPPCARVCYIDEAPPTRTSQFTTSLLPGSGKVAGVVGCIDVWRSTHQALRHCGRPSAGTRHALSAAPPAPW